MEHFCCHFNIYDAVLDFHGFHDSNSYEDWRIHMEHFFVTFPCFQRKYYCAQPDLVEETFD